MLPQNQSYFIFLPVQLWDATIGGIQTVISLLIATAPNEFEVRLWDKTIQLNRSGKWQKQNL
jgi:hypothetical protein